MDVPELTKEAYHFIDDLLDIYKETHGSKHDVVGKLANLRGSGYGNFNISEMPVEHPNYGQLVTDPSKRYYLKARYPETWDDIEVTDKMGDPYERENKHGGHYTNECFGEARIWLEAQERGEEHMKIFAPVVGYDGEDFRWTVMLHCEFMDSWKRQTTPYESDPQKLGWMPHDTECGLLNGRKVAYDYGMWRRENNEWLVAEEDIFKENPVFRF